MQEYDMAPRIFQAENEHGAYEIRLLVELDGKLVGYSREWLNEDQRNAVLTGELRVAHMLWEAGAGSLNYQVHWCVSGWRRQKFAPLVRNDLVFEVRARRLISRVMVEKSVEDKAKRTSCYTDEVQPS